MGPDPTYVAGPEQLPAQGRVTTLRKSNKARGGVDMGISSDGDSNGGSGFQGDRGIHHNDAKYGHTIYCDATDYVPL